MRRFSIRIYVLPILALMAVLAADGMAQPPRGGGGGRPSQFMGGGGGMPGLGGSYELLSREDVRKELELLDDQMKQLEGLRNKLVERARDAITRIRAQRGDGQNGAIGDQARDGFRQAMEQVNAEIHKELSQVLLPHQLKRLDQLALQLRMRGGVSALGGEVAEQLNITDQQREQLRGKSEEIERELRKKIAELRRQAQNDLLSILTPEQQAKIRDMVGEPFEFAEPERRPSDGGPGGPAPRRN